MEHNYFEVPQNLDNKRNHPKSVVLNGREFKQYETSDASDLDILKDKEAFYNDMRFAYSDTFLEKLKLLTAEPGCVSLVIKKEVEGKEKFAGFIIASKSKHYTQELENYSWIYELFVDPDFQGYGIGRYLVQEVVIQSYAKGMNGALVQTENENEPAKSLYEKVQIIIAGNQYGFSLFETPDGNDKFTTYKIDLPLRQE